jgi:hypothetical protein
MQHMRIYLLSWSLIAVASISDSIANPTTDSLANITTPSQNQTTINDTNSSFSFVSQFEQVSYFHFGFYISILHGFSMFDFEASSPFVLHTKSQYMENFITYETRVLNVTLCTDDLYNNSAVNISFDILQPIILLSNHCFLNDNYMGYEWIDIVSCLSGGRILFGSKKMFYINSCLRPFVLAPNKWMRYTGEIGFSVDTEDDESPISFGLFYSKDLFKNNYAAGMSLHVWSFTDFVQLWADAFSLSFF